MTRTVSRPGPEATPPSGVSSRARARPTVRRRGGPAGWWRRPWILPVVAASIAVIGLDLWMVARVDQVGSAVVQPLVLRPLNVEAPQRVPTVSVRAGTVRATVVAAPEAGAPVAADPLWVARAARLTGIPQRAVAAYAGASLTLARTRPGCHLDWSTLAGIGEVETLHGALNNAHLGGDGVVRPSIIGLALNGHGVAAIADTDRGRLDGDATWDHAVGPMQFLPATWARYGQDGNADGRADINQIDDAARTAGEYLCTVGGDLSIGKNWIRAIAAYNSGLDYNHRVATAANRYAAGR